MKLPPYFELALWYTYGEDVNKLSIEHQWYLLGHHPTYYWRILHGNAPSIRLIL